MSYFPQKEAITYQLDILTQKIKDGKFQTTKSKRFVLNVIDDYTMETQKIYDTLYGKPINTEIKYEYYRNTCNNLRKMSFFNFNGDLKKELVFNYDENGMLSFEIEYDENGEDKGKETVGRYYYMENCKSEYIADIIDDMDVDKINQIFSCYTTETVKKISNYTTSIVDVSKNYEVIKELVLQGNKDSKINRFYTYTRDDNGNVISINMTKGEKVKHYKTNTYNEKGDLTYTKSGYVELFYAYKYDENGNWIEKIETSKVKSKRRIFKRTYKY